MRSGLSLLSEMRKRPISILISICTATITLHSLKVSAVIQERTASGLLPVWDTSGYDLFG